MNDFLAGTTQIHSEPNVMPHVKAGKAKLLAIADRERHPDYPNVPLISEIYPDIAIVGWFGLFAPAGTSPATIKRLNDEFNKIAALPQMRTDFLALALRPTTGSPEKFVALIKEDWNYYGNLEGGEQGRGAAARVVVAVPGQRASDYRPDSGYPTRNFRRSRFRVRTRLHSHTGADRIVEGAQAGIGWKPNARNLDLEALGEHFLNRFVRSAAYITQSDCRT